MKVFPAVHYSMGGLWVDFEAAADGGLVHGSPRNQQINIPGLFVVGEADWMECGPVIRATSRGTRGTVEEMDGDPFEAELERREAQYEAHLSMDDEGNSSVIHQHEFRTEPAGAPERYARSPPRSNSCRWTHPRSQSS